jgi:hypothetical protein
MTPYFIYIFEIDNIDRLLQNKTKAIRFLQLKKVAYFNLKKTLKLEGILKCKS